MIQNADQLKAKVKNLSGGDSQKTLTFVEADETMKVQWENFKTDSFFVGELSWEEIMTSVKVLAEDVI